MHKYFTSIIVILIFACLSSCASTQYTEEKKEAVDFVKNAIEYYKNHGKKKVILEMNKKGGLFDKGEIYVFAYDLKGTVLAIPTKPHLVGKNLYHMVDFKGEFYRKEIIDGANRKGSGWVRYTYQHPTTKDFQKKMTYFEKYNDMIFCCGIYYKN